MGMAKMLTFSLHCILIHTTLLPFSQSKSVQQVPKAQSGGVVPPVELWCVAKNNAEDSPLQRALDWVCGAGGADCSPIQLGGHCYDPSDIQNTASYAFNDYFLKNGLTDDSCNFDNTAAVTSLNPSHDNCKFPSSLTVSNGSFSGSTSSVGLRPSENISGCSRRHALRWFWLVISVIYLLPFHGSYQDNRNFSPSFFLKSFPNTAYTVDN